MATESSSRQASIPTSTCFTTITWNIEGLKRNKFTLKNFADLVSADFIFLNETQTFLFEAENAASLLLGEYCYELNSDDKHDTELSMIKNKSYGGTMALWKKSLNQYVTVLPTETSSFLPILFQPPGSPESVHLSIYLPTSGKESEFVDEIVKIRIFLDDFLTDHPGCIIFIRGDSNVNTNNAARMNVFKHFKNTYEMNSVPINHKTYHHFLGAGLYDSNIDVIMHTKTRLIHEEIKTVFCQTEHPSIDSHQFDKFEE